MSLQNEPVSEAPRIYVTLMFHTGNSPAAQTATHTHPYPHTHAPPPPGQVLAEAFDTTDTRKKPNGPATGGATITLRVMIALRMIPI